MPRVVCQVCGREFSVYLNGCPKRHKQNAVPCPGSDLPGIVPVTTAVEYTEPNRFRRETKDRVRAILGTVSTHEGQAEYVLLDTRGYQLNGQALDDLIAWLAQARERLR